MGLLSRHSRQSSAESDSSDKTGNTKNPEMETVVEYASDHIPALSPPDERSEHDAYKTASTQQSRPPFLARGNSMSESKFPRKQSMFVVSQQQVQDPNEYESSEQDPSFTFRRKWKSSRLQPGEVYDKPWAAKKDPRRAYEKMIFLTGCTVGFAIGAYLMYTSWISVTNSEYCPILQDNFTNGIDPDVWNFEIQRGGFGVQSFEWTTDDPSNVYTDEKGLHIVPTLTANYSNYKEQYLLDGYTLNLTADGTCTTNRESDCVITSNSSTGSMINPVRSGRINTKNKRAIKYGKVEVVAKLPRGDWLWPAIWMMPQDSVYGEWPLSGEIDIMESRGNYPGFPSGGRDAVSATLHWGPNHANDGYWRTLGVHYMPRDDFSNDFHTFGLEWGEKYMFMYLDSRLLQVSFIKWTGQTMWDLGDFGRNSNNQTALNDPWTWTGRPNTPFDQEFFLILNVAVGGQNGFFVDGMGNKPWLDGSESAPRAFWQAANLWYPTWGGGDTAGMTVQSVKMWSLGKCGSA